MKRPILANSALKEGQQGPQGRACWQYVQRLCVCRCVCGGGWVWVRVRVSV